MKKSLKFSPADLGNFTSKNTIFSVFKNFLIKNLMKIKSKLTKITPILGYYITIFNFTIFIIIIINL